MTISNQPTSLLDSVLQAQTTQQDAGVAVLKKAQDLVKQQGQAMVQLLEQSGISPAGSKLDATGIHPPVRSGTSSDRDPPKVGCSTSRIIQQ